MSQKFTLNNERAGYQLFIFFSFSFVSFCIGSLIGILLLQPLFGISMFANPLLLQDLQNPKTVDALRFLQLVQSIFLFIVPTIFFYKIQSSKSTSYSWFQHQVSLITILCLITLMIAWLPITDFTASLNKQIQIPDLFKDIEIWMKEKEMLAENLTKALLKMNSIAEFLYVLILVAILPAIGEELFFRGTLQPLLSRLVKNPHVGIWITAIIFSAIHFQFYGFLPRMLLGAVFGYLFYWSGNIFLPIIGHFINNGAAVIASYFYQQQNPEKILEDVSNASFIQVIGGFAFAIPLLYYFYQNRTKTTSIYQQTKNEYGTRLG